MLPNFSCKIITIYLKNKTIFEFSFIIWILFINYDIHIKYTHADY
jgi:hypothetical protein